MWDALKLCPLFCPGSNKSALNDPGALIRWIFSQGQTPYRFHSRNHGLCAYISSCVRFAADRSLNWSGLVSGRTKMRSSHSISAIACSASILPQFLPELRRRRKRLSLRLSFHLYPLRPDERESRRNKETVTAFYDLILIV